MSCFLHFFNVGLSVVVNEDSLGGEVGHLHRHDQGIVVGVNDPFFVAFPESDGWCRLSPS